MQIEKLPDLKSAVLTKRITLAVSPELKSLIEELKRYGKDPAGCVREILSNEIPKALKTLAANERFSGKAPLAGIEPTPCLPPPK